MLSSVKLKRVDVCLWTKGNHTIDSKDFWDRKKKTRKRNGGFKCTVARCVNADWFVSIFEGEMEELTKGTKRHRNWYIVVKKKKKKNRAKHFNLNWLQDFHGYLWLICEFSPCVLTLALSLVSAAAPLWCAFLFFHCSFHVNPLVGTLKQKPEWQDPGWLLKDIQRHQISLYLQKRLPFFFFFVFLKLIFIGV